MSTIQHFETVENWVVRRDELLSHRLRIGFVPTMGALHDGHLSLLKRAAQENDFVLTSVFVNPTQFNSKEDLEKYPRTIDRDLSLIQKFITRETVGHESEITPIGVLTPSEKEIYSDKYSYKVVESEKSKILCGAFRPGHFEGVLTVVLKLLGIAQATKCYMGEKDYQQFLLIQEMAKSFFMKTQIVPCATVREPSGLAMSSRNERLSPEGKMKAALIYKTLNNTKSTLSEKREFLVSQGFEVEYLEEHWGRRFIAAWLENVRLIDNVKI